MYMKGVGFVLLALHLLVCALAVSGAGHGRWKARPELLMVVLCVPLWGAVCALLLRLWPQDPARAAVLGVEPLRVDEDLFRSAPARKEERPAPLEDILLLAPAAQRRRWTRTFLDDSAGADPALLRLAQHNEDVEVVHYAATALAERSKAGDLALQRAQAAAQAAPQDPACRDALLRALHDALAAAQLPRHLQTDQRREYAALLAQRQKEAPTLACGAELVRQLLLLGERTQADGALDLLARRWPRAQEVWLLRLESAVRGQDGSRLRQVLREAQEQQIWFDAAGRAAMEFWQKGAQA